MTVRWVSWELLHDLRMNRWVSTELLHAYGGALLAGTYDPRTNRWVSWEYVMMSEPKRFMRH